MATICRESLGENKTWFIGNLEDTPQLQGTYAASLSKLNDQIYQQWLEPSLRVLELVENRNQQRRQELLNYLGLLHHEVQVRESPEFTEHVLNVAWQVWEKLEDHFRSKGAFLDLPDACPGQQDNFMYTWSQDEHYLECEIFSNGKLEFFYRNRKGGEIWGEDTTLYQEFSAEILAKVELFA